MFCLTGDALRPVLVSVDTDRHFRGLLRPVYPLDIRTSSLADVRTFAGRGKPAVPKNGFGGPSKQMLEKFQKLLDTVFFLG
jgi:hypothetical protein